MTNQNLYDLVNFVMRKNGVSEPLTGQRFELLLQQENKNHYKDMVTTYMKSQKVMDSLSPFEVRVLASALSATVTTLDLPTNYAHFVGMYHTDDDSIVRPFDMVTDDEWDMRCRNRITLPTENNPICKIVKNKIYIKPSISLIENVKHGYLYNGYVAINVNISPSGWHIPTRNEYITMENFLIANGYNYDGTISGDKVAKSICTDEFWAYSSVVGSVGNTDYESKRNVTEFSLMPSGVLNNLSGFLRLNEQAVLWTNTLATGTTYRVRSAYNNQVDYVDGGSDIKVGSSIRFIRDNDTGWSEGDTITDLDGNIYGTVKVGTQIFTKQNWACTKYNDGTPISNVTDWTNWTSLTDGAYVAYNNDETNVFI
jgi:uncharacterized protein (TIGR02145 family)